MTIELTEEELEVISIIRTGMDAEQLSESHELLTALEDASEKYRRAGLFVVQTAAPQEKPE